MIGRYDGRRIQWKCNAGRERFNIGVGRIIGRRRRKTGALERSFITLKLNVACDAGKPNSREYGGFFVQLKVVWL